MEQSEKKSSNDHQNKEIRETQSEDQQTQEEILKSIENLPEEERQSFLLKIERTEMYSGPLPHPQILKQYAEVSEKFPDEILKMAKEEAEFRHEYDKKEQHMRSRDSLIGMIFSFVLCSLLIVLGTLVALKSSPAAGTILSGLGIGSVVITLIKGTRPDKKQ